MISNGTQVADHFMRRVENIVYHVNHNRWAHDDSEILDQVAQSINRLMIDYNRMKRLDTKTFEEALRNANEG